MDKLISKRLRHRVRTLSTILGETMSRQHGHEFLDKVEEIRLLAKAKRQDSDSGDHEKLSQVLRNLDDENLLSIARAFNQFLNLTNIAEQAESTEDGNSESQLEEIFRRLIDQGVDNNRIIETINELHCDLVLTAHPTEITRRTLIQKYNRIASALEKVDEDTTLDAEAQIHLERMIAEVWYTDEIRTERPKPQDEAIWGYAVIEHSLWHAIPDLWDRLEFLLFKYTGAKLSLQVAPVKISSWMGGDRDGNPNVTARVTGEVLRLARWMAADLYLRDIEELLSQLSMATCNEALRAQCPEGHNEPYRFILRKLREQLTETRAWAEASEPPHAGLILTTTDLTSPLKVCYDSLHDCGMGIIADGLLKKILVRTTTFGVTLVELDIRQSSNRISNCSTLSLNILGSVATLTGQRQREQNSYCRKSNPTVLCSRIAGCLGPKQQQKH